MPLFWNYYFVWLWFVFCSGKPEWENENYTFPSSPQRIHKPKVKLDRSAHSSGHDGVTRCILYSSCQFMSILPSHCLIIHCTVSIVVSPIRVTLDRSSRFQLNGFYVFHFCKRGDRGGLNKRKTWLDRLKINTYSRCGLCFFRLSLRWSS